MANALLTPSVIAKEALMQLENTLIMGNNVHKEYKDEFVKVGSTVSIRKPVKFVTTDGATLTKQDVEEGNTSIVVNSRKHVGWEFATGDLTLTIEDYSKRYIQPAMIALAQDVESSLTGLYADVFNFAGTPGTVPNTFAHLGLAGRILDDNAVPEGRKGIFNPEATWSLADGLKAVFVQGKAKTALEEARMGYYARMDTYMGQSIKVHTVGVATGTPLVNGADQDTTYALSKTTNSQSLITDGWTADTAGILTEGDVFTIAGVYAVNPNTKASTGALQTFVVNTTVASGATTGPATLDISPAIIATGAYQNVTAVPANDAVITVKGTGGTGYAQNLCYHPNAFALVTCPLAMPDGVSFKARESHNGLSVRVVKDYDIANDTDIIRLDILYGVKTIYPELACRLTS